MVNRAPASQDSRASDPALRTLPLDRPQAGQAMPSAPDDFDEGMLLPLQELYEPEGAIELIQTMHEDLARKRRDYQAALDKQDRVAAARVAHSLKSEVRIVSALPLGHALEAVEQAFKSGDFSAAASAMSELLQRSEILFLRLRAAAGI
jgi:HPt (histidine-containing phosphotransfer) domain-containing protein